MSTIQEDIKRLREVREDAKEYVQDDVDRVKRVCDALEKATEAIAQMPCACPGETGICSKCSYCLDVYGTDVG